MIWESRYWKEDLLKYSSKLKNRINQKKWFDSSLANTEKEIMLSAFMIRKLGESNRISDELINQNVKILEYENNGKKIDIIRRLAPERFFKIDNPHRGTISINDLCNSIIHSYVFVLIFYDNTFKSFWVASDHNRYKRLYEIEIDQYINILNEIGSYWPKTGVMKYDNKRKDYRFKWD